MNALPELVSALKPKQVRAHVRPRLLAESDEPGLVAQLRAASEGWVCFTDKALTLDALRRETAAPPQRRLLSAETWDGGRSLAVRPAEGGWCVVELWEAPDGPHELLAFDEVFLGDRAAPSTIRTYWRRATGELGEPWRPWVSAFLGFSSEGARP